MPKGSFAESKGKYKLNFPYFQIFKVKFLIKIFRKDGAIQKKACGVRQKAI